MYTMLTIAYHVVVHFWIHKHIVFPTKSVILRQGSCKVTLDSHPVGQPMFTDMFTRGVNPLLLYTAPSWQSFYQHPPHGGAYASILNTHPEICINGCIISHSLIAMTFYYNCYHLLHWSPCLMGTPSPFAPLPPLLLAFTPRKSPATVTYKPSFSARSIVHLCYSATQYFRFYHFSLENFSMTS